ncbi:hypothetical protein Nepgr_012012 [Nepenthes gracilis]|uniref:Uncharacterized protein n=1 Tax=Nepenthes gracilis TaxID=150966 RepID=A0AAD3XMW3_NEPGR|nr:hypothetical protein Nepgr_012012 [Nepenthes gracilis]
MFRLALRKLTRAATAIATSTGSRTAVGGGFSRGTPSALSAPLSTGIRLYCAKNIPNANPVALQMINYALGLARSQKSDESYAQALLVLEQCLSSQSQEGHDTTIENSKGMVLLAISTLLSECGNTDEAIHTLLRIQDLTSSSVGIRVAAVESLVGLNLELGLVDTSSVLADNCLKLLEKESQEVGDDFSFKVFNARAKAIKGLVELVQCDLESAKTFFQVCEEESCIGNAALSYGEFLHTKRDFNSAKEVYRRVISGSSEKKDFSDPFALAACNMASEEVLLGATCALGQLESHLGNFGDAEEILTKALKQAEEHFGSYHPKVGIVLMCIALMFRHKATSEHSSSLLIQEGLYRRALDLLKALPLETDGAKENVDKRDIVALARGGYAETLRVQQSRRDEGERMRSWAQAAWRNRRLSLAEALDITEPCFKVPVIDARICRVL